MKNWNTPEEQRIIDTLSWSREGFALSMSLYDWRMTLAARYGFVSEETRNSHRKTLQEYAGIINYNR